MFVSMLLHVDMEVRMEVHSDSRPGTKMSTVVKIPPHSATFRKYSSRQKQRRMQVL